MWKPSDEFVISILLKLSGIAKHNMSTFVRSSTSRSSLKHRLFTVADENEIDDEEDDEEFEQFIKDNQIFDESSYINIKGIFMYQTKCLIKYL